MSDQPTAPGVPDRPPDSRPAGPARDFAAFCELDRERRRNSDDGFDPSLFEEAAALVLGRLDPQGAARSSGPSSATSSTPSSPQGTAADRP
jgi:hypothetical protein